MERHLFEVGMAHLLLYNTQFGNLNISDEYVSPDGFKLGKYVAELREEYLDQKARLVMGADTNDLISVGQIMRLNTMGFSFDKDLQDWEYMFKLTSDYVTTNGGLPGRNYRTEDNIMLGAWVWRQRGLYGFLTPKQQEKLSEIGME